MAAPGQATGRKGPGLKKSETVRGFADTLSVAPRTMHMRRHDCDYVVFCFAKPEDARAFCQHFGGERLARSSP
jgi:hypothetical protein